MPPPFATDHLSDEATCVATLLSALKWDDDRRLRIALQAERFVQHIRDHKGGLGEIETFLEHYPLDSPEGLALMTLAEALLRVPDAATADALIADKLAAGKWKTGGTSGVMKLAGIGMDLARKTLGAFPDRAERSLIRPLERSLIRPLIRKGTEEAIRRIGQQFVVGENIADALSAAKKLEHQGYRMSYDMLGEGARTAADADRYFERYSAAADTIGKAESLQQKPGISVKLSALHPRYTWTQKDSCVPDIIDRLSQLCWEAAESNISLTVDAEEADRLEISWEIISAVARLPHLRAW